MKKANLTWVHLFTDIVDSGDLAAMGPYNFTTLMAIKCCAAVKDGQSCPTIEEVVRYTDISRRQVIYSFKWLEKEGYIKVERQGRRKIYTLTERVLITGSDGELEMAEFDYVPMAVQEVRKQLKEYLDTNKLPKGSQVVIHQLNINIQLGRNSNINPTTNFHIEDVKDPVLREKLRKVIHNYKNPTK